MVILRSQNEITDFSIILVWVWSLSNLDFHPLEVASRYRDTYIQEGENCILFNYRPNICKSRRLNATDTTPGLIINVVLIVINELYLRPQLTSSACFSLIYPSIINRFSWNSVQIIFRQNLNIPENLVKLYIVFRKLDHLTCSKLK